MLGYHVHEKAILLAILSFSLDAAKSPKQACIFHRLSNIGHFSLLPLIFTHEEYPLKVRCSYVFIMSCTDYQFLSGNVPELKLELQVATSLLMCIFRFRCMQHPHFSCCTEQLESLISYESLFVSHTSHIA